MKKIPLSCLWRGIIHIYYINETQENKIVSSHGSGGHNLFFITEWRWIDMAYDAYDLSWLDPDMSVEDIMKQITIDGRSHVIVDQQEAFNTSMNYRHYADGLG